MDIEGYAKTGLRKGDPELVEKLTDRILEVKSISRESARRLSEAVILEAKTTLDIKDEIIALQPCGVTMGEFGVGSRGRGDFYAHKKIAEVIGKTSAVCDSSQMDDSGVVKAGGQYVVVTVDGMHSRLSDFPFLAGFHCTRASLRDLYVMGAKPVALFSDIHIADDGDVAKIYDYTAGIGTVSELINVPLVTGSTLRIGGDMVIGDRMTGCVGAVGVAQEPDDTHTDQPRRRDHVQRRRRRRNGIDHRAILRHAGRGRENAEREILRGLRSFAGTQFNRQDPRDDRRDQRRHPRRCL